MTHWIARFLSVLFHPLMMPTLGLWLIFLFDPSSAYLPLVVKRLLMLVVAGTTLIVPLSLMPLFKTLGLIHSFSMETRRERFWPMLSTGFSFGLGFWLLMRVPMVPGIVETFMWVAILSVVIALTITLFWKISIHMVGVGGLSALMVLLLVRSGDALVWPLMLAFTAAGAIGWARLRLDAHQPSEVYTGFGLGWCMVLYGVWWL